MKGFFSYIASNQDRAGYAFEIDSKGVLIDLQRACELHAKLIAKSSYRQYPNDLRELFCDHVDSTGLLTVMDEVVSLIQSFNGDWCKDEDLGSVQIPDEEIQFGPAIPCPGKIICVGMNYPSGTSPQHQDYPTLFLKASSTLVGSAAPVVLPAVSKRVFCEGELAIIIGKRGKHIPAESAWDYVAGLTIGTDIGAEDLEARTTQWQTGKLPDTFTPLGPFIIPLRAITDKEGLGITVYINDQLVLSGNTSQMIFPPAYLIHYVSSITTLMPGDVILTGSPKGIEQNPASRAYIADGDTIRVAIQSLGELVNPVWKEEVKQ